MPEDPHALLRTSKIVSIVGVGMLVSGASYLFGLGTLNPDFNTPLSFAVLVGIVLGFLFLLVSLVGRQKALQNEAALRSVGRGSLSNTQVVDTTLIVTLFVVVIEAWVATPTVMRMMYGVPIQSQPHEERVVQQQDPTFIGCFQDPSALGNYRVQCKGTGHDQLLEFLMRMPR